MARHHKINLGPANENQPQTEEALADVAITPGAIVYRQTSGGQIGQFALATAALAVDGRQLYIADHNYTAGRNTDDDNPADETMISQVPLPRMRYAALLLNGQNVTARDVPLKVSATAGVLDIGTVGTDHIVAYAREAYNNTTSNPQLIAVRWATV